MIGEIIQIMPLNFKVEAVFGNTDTMTVSRDRVFALGLTKASPTADEEITPITWVDGDKIFDKILGCFNFLGLEIEGNKLNWEKDLQLLKDKELIRKCE